MQACPPLHLRTIKDWRWERDEQVVYGTVSGMHKHCWCDPQCLRLEEQS